MQVLNFFEPEKRIQYLLQDTLVLVRQSRETKTMKELLTCYDILKLTDDINQKWEEHPGWMYGDEAAFQDLYKIAGCLMLYADPSRDQMLKYIQELKRLIRYWRMISEREVG